MHASKSSFAAKLRILNVLLAQYPAVVHDVPASDVGRRCRGCISLVCRGVLLASVARRFSGRYCTAGTWQGQLAQPCQLSLPYATLQPLLLLISTSVLAPAARHYRYDNATLFADRLLGKYHTILYLSLFYCLGHGTLALWESRGGLYAGLLLIALGSGGIKPCVSAFVGDQFTGGRHHLLQSVFNMFYW